MQYVFEAKVTACQECQQRFLGFNDGEECPECDMGGVLVEIPASSADLQALYDIEGDWPHCEPFAPLFPNPNGEAVVAIKPDMARLLLGLLTQSSSHGSLPAVHVHPCTPQGSCLIVRQWQGDSTLEYRAMASQLDDLREQLVRWATSREPITESTEGEQE